MSKITEKAVQLPRKTKLVRVSGLIEETSPTRLQSHGPKKSRAVWVEVDAVGGNAYKVRFLDNKGGQAFRIFAVQLTTHRWDGDSPSLHELNEDNFVFKSNDRRDDGARGDDARKNARVHFHAVVVQ